MKYISQIQEKMELNIIIGNVIKKWLQIGNFPLNAGP
jgi:hypothetical protein